MSNHVCNQTGLITSQRKIYLIKNFGELKWINLYEMTKDLIEQKALPPMFDDACWIIRLLGIRAAHADKQTFYIQEVNQTIEFLETMINYLYSLPAKIGKLKEKIKQQ